MGTFTRVGADNRFVRVKGDGSTAAGATTAMARPRQPAQLHCRQCGYYHACGLKPNGNRRLLGLDSYGQASVPGAVASPAISAGGYAHLWRED